MHEDCGAVLDAQITVRQHLVSALLARQIVSLFKARTVKPRRGVCFPEYRRYDVAADNIEKFHCTFLDIIRVRHRFSQHMLRDQQQKRPVGIEYQPDLVAAVGRGMNGAEIHVLKTVGCSAVYVHDADISQASLHLLVNDLIQIVIAQRMVCLLYTSDKEKLKRYLPYSDALPAYC